MDARPIVFGDLRLGFARGLRNAEQISRLGHVLSAIAVGEQSVVADAVEALRQHVDQEVRNPSEAGHRARRKPDSNSMIADSR